MENKSKLNIFCGLLIGSTLAIGASAQTISPVDPKIPTNSKSTVIIYDNRVDPSDKNAVIDDVLASFKITKWEFIDVTNGSFTDKQKEDGVAPIKREVELTAEELKDFLITPPVRRINEGKEYATRILYKGVDRDIQKAYRFYIIAKKQNAIKTGSSVQADLYHNLPLLIDPSNPLEKLEVTKKGNLIYIKNIGNISYRASEYKVDGVTVKEKSCSKEVKECGNLPTPFLLPNSTWTIKGKEVEIGKNILRK